MYGTVSKNIERILIRIFNQNADPDPRKGCGSMRIRIRNTGFSSPHLYKTKEVVEWNHEVRYLSPVHWPDLLLVLWPPHVEDTVLATRQHQAILNTE